MKINFKIIRKNLTIITQKKRNCANPRNLYHGITDKHSNEIQFARNYFKAAKHWIMHRVCTVVTIMYVCISTEDASTACIDVAPNFLCSTDFKGVGGVGFCGKRRAIPCLEVFPCFNILCQLFFTQSDPKIANLLD